MSRDKKEKKGYLEFVLLILAGGLLGGVGSVVIGEHVRDVKRLGDILQMIIGKGAFWFIVIMSVAGSIANAYMVLTVKKKYREWDEEDDEAAEEIERYNSRCQGIITCCTTMAMLLSGVNIAYGIHRPDSLNALAVIPAFFVWYCLWSAIAVHILIEQTKKVNPEKKGNALSLHFNRDWEKSCDEQERGRMYAAAYVVYRKSNWLYAGIYVFLLMLSVAVDIGVLPFLILGIIWIYQTVLYICNYEKKH